MANSLNPTEYIYEGLWTDWTKGSVWGLTWTLSPTSAVILTNSLAVFVTLCGVQIWTIVRYALHQRGVSLQPEPTTPHLNKEQLILRNADSALATARLMLELAWTSRQSTGKPSLRAYLIGLTAAIYAIMFTAASIFSNEAIIAASTNGGSAVLLRSNHCGVWNETYVDIVQNQHYSNEMEFGMYAQYQAKKVQDIQLSLQYSQECYMSQAVTTGTSSACHNLKASTVGWESASAGSCPFGPQTCDDRAEVVVLDTGEVNSHDDLGINAKPSDRLNYRRVTTCAVLNGTSHTNGWNGTVGSSSSIEPSQDTAYAFYGPSHIQNTSWTYSISNFASFYTNNSAGATRPYLVYVMQAYPTSSSNDDFDPIPELAQENSDLNLIFMSFTGTYLGQVNDPWFSARDETVFGNARPFLEKRYAPDEAIKTIGCTEQHNFCNSHNLCTGLLGFEQVQEVAEFNAALTPNQNATFDRMLRAVATSRLWHVIQALTVTTDPLLASNVSMSGKSGAVLSKALPDNQWELELRYWHSVAMAQLQRAVLQWATGQIAAEPQEVQYLLPPTEPQDIWFCKNLVVPSFTYKSFSVVAIVLIVVFGTLISIASLFVEHLAAAVRKCLRKSAPKEHWVYDDMLDLRRYTLKARWRPPPLPKDDQYCPASQRRKPRGSLGSNTTASVADDAKIPSQTHASKQCASPYVNRAFAMNHQTRVEPCPQRIRNSSSTSSLSSIGLKLLEDHTNAVDHKQNLRGPRMVASSRSVATTRYFNPAAGRKSRNLTPTPGAWI